MSWYNLCKTSALEKHWWSRFYLHLVQTLQFEIPQSSHWNDPKISQDNALYLNKQSFSSGIDGNTLFFNFLIYRGGHEYHCHIGLEFSDSIVMNSKQWANANLQGLDADNLVKADWYAMRDLRTGAVLAGKGYLLADKATPLALVRTIKNAILNDSDDSGNDDEEEGISGGPRGGKRIEPVLV